MHLGGMGASRREVSRLSHLFDECPAKPRLEYLEQKDRLQNGTMDRIEKKVDRVLWAIIGGLGAVCLALIGLLAGLLT